MYRNVSILHGDNHQTIIRLRTWGSLGHPEIKDIEHNPHVLYEVPRKTKLQSIYGTYLDKKYFKNNGERKKWVENHPELKLFEVMDPKTEFLVSEFIDKHDDEKFSQFPLRVHFLDIEIAVGANGDDSFPEPRIASQPINLITIFDSIDKKFYSWAMGDIKEKHPAVELFQFKTEEDLLKHFLIYQQKKNPPDVYCGWNSLKFDIPYLYNRINNTLGSEYAKKLSPDDNVFITDKFDAHGRTYQRVFISGITQWDYLLLYRDKFLYRCPTSFKLGDVCEHEINEQKLPSTAKSFKDRWQNHFDEYLEYNIHDVRLLVKLEEKLQLLELARSICNMCLVPYETIYPSIPYLSNGLSIHSQKTFDKVFPTVVNKENMKEEYPGAFVMPPRKGFYNHGIVTIDLNSLYPNTIVALNISPETKIGKIVEIDDHKELHTTDHRKIVLNEKQLKELVTTKTVLSKNNVLYLKPDIKLGVIPSFVKHYYSERLKNKAKLKKYEKELAESKEQNLDDIRIQSLSENIKRLKTKDISYKAFLNSIYGMFGTNFSPIYDVDSAAAITVSDQGIIQKTISFIDNHFNKEFGIEKSVIGADTDSNFFNVEPIVLKYCEINNKDINTLKHTDIKKITKELDIFLETLVNKEVQDYVEKEMFTSEAKRIEFKREYFAMQGCFFSKKHYFVHIVDEDGNKADKFKYTGIEIRKNEYPAKVKSLIQEIYEKTCIDNWTEIDYIHKLENVWKTFRTLTFNEISIYRGYNTPRNTSGFLHMEKGATGHSKAANFYNQLIDKFGLQSKYEKINVGDQIRTCYITENEWGISIIGFKDSFPKEFEPLFNIDYMLMFNKMVNKPLHEFCKLMNWRQFDPRLAPKIDIFSL